MGSAAVAEVVRAVAARKPASIVRIIVVISLGVIGFLLVRN
jgi:hypothetical protein